MFTQRNGKPIDPRRDQYQCKALLKEAGVREARLHDARHTAATTLAAPGQSPERAVMEVMGWSNSAMVKRYAHVTARLRRDIADRLNSFLWTAQTANETRNETETGVMRASDARSLHRYAWSEVVVRGRVELPTFRFSGVAYAKVSLIVRVLCAAASRCC